MTSSIDKSRRVFVVHGRSPLRDEVVEFLRALHLAPLEWEEVVSLTRESSPYIGRVLKMGFDSAAAAVVLLTGDDVAMLRKPLASPHDLAFETILTPQPRPNVLIETGMALALYESRTLILQSGNIRSASDLLGRHVIHLDNRSQTRKAMVSRLKASGCQLNDEGTDWLSVGNLDPVHLGDEGRYSWTDSAAPGASATSVSDPLTDDEKSVLVRMLPSGRCTHWTHPNIAFIRIGSVMMGRNEQQAPRYIYATHNLEKRRLIVGVTGQGNGRSSYFQYELSHEGRRVAIELDAAGFRQPPGTTAVFSDPEDFSLSRTRA